MTVEQFRKHKFLPSEWAKLLETNGILQRVLEVMDDNHPAHFAVATDVQDDLSPTRAALELGLTRGYTKYGDTLKLLAKRPPASMQDLETTYEKPPVEEELRNA